MNISLTQELERFVTKKVQSGMYHSASEVVREGLRLLKEQDEVRQLRLKELRKEIAVGIEDIEQGRYTEYDEAGLEGLVEEVKNEGRNKMSGHPPQRRK
jgi:antitoxin ParD1/3/4